MPCGLYGGSEHHRDLQIPHIDPKTILRGLTASIIKNSFKLSIHLVFGTGLKLPTNRILLTFVWQRWEASWLVSLHPGESCTKKPTGCLTCLKCLGFLFEGESMGSQREEFMSHAHPWILRAQKIVHSEGGGAPPEHSEGGGVGMFCIFFHEIFCFNSNEGIVLKWVRYLKTLTFDKYEIHTFRL